MVGQPITRLEWWIGVFIVLTALAVHAVFVSQSIRKIEAKHEPRVIPVASALAPAPYAEWGPLSGYQKPVVLTVSGP